MNEVSLTYDDSSDLFYEQLFKGYLNSILFRSNLLNNMVKDKYIKKWGWPMGKIVIYTNNGLIIEISMFI